jgi:hypothetical protein
MRGLVLAIAAAAAAMLLAGCAAMGAAGAAGEIVGKVQVPAIVAIEATVAADLGRAIDDVGRDPPNQGEARAMIDAAGRVMARLETARLAWEAIFGSDASPPARRLVDDARAATDAIYVELLAKLEPYASA